MGRLKVHCVGSTPLLMDPMTDETLEGLITGVRPNKPKDRPLKEVCKEKFYRQYGDKGKIGIRAECLFACLAAAGRNVKNGKKQISVKGATVLPGLLQIKTFFMPLTNIEEGKEDEAWQVDKRRGQLDSGGKKVAVPIIRPRFDQWEFDVEIEYDEKVVNESVIRALFENAGRYQGLLSFRPNKNGMFGQFKVAKWEVVEQSKEELAQAA